MSQYDASSNTELQLRRSRTLKAFYDAEDRYIKEGGGDFSTIAATLHPECVIFQPASLPYGGEWRGHAGFEAWMKAFAQQWSSMEVRNPETFVQEDRIFSRSHVYATARANGKKLDWPLLQMIQFREALIADLQPFYWDTSTLLSGLLPSRA